MLKIIEKNDMIIIFNDQIENDDLYADGYAIHLDGLNAETVLASLFHLAIRNWFCEIDSSFLAKFTELVLDKLYQK